MTIEIDQEVNYEEHGWGQDLYLMLWVPEDNPGNPALLEDPIVEDTETPLLLAN